MFKKIVKSMLVVAAVAVIAGGREASASNTRIIPIIPSITRRPDALYLIRDMYKLTEIFNNLNKAKTVEEQQKIILDQNNTIRLIFRRSSLSEENYVVLKTFLEKYGREGGPFNGDNAASIKSYFLKEAIWCRRFKVADLLINYNSSPKQVFEHCINEANSYFMSEDSEFDLYNLLDRLDYMLRKNFLNSEDIKLAKEVMVKILDKIKFKIELI